MGKWRDSTQELERLLRLRTFPLAIKRLEKKEDIEKIPRVRMVGERHTFCQLVGQSRKTGFTVISMPEDNAACAHMLGLAKAPKENWHARVGVWFENKEAAEAQYEAIPTVPFKGHAAVVVSPLASEKFDPDLVLVHANPAQMHLLMCAFIYKDYFRWECTFVGETSCSDTVAKAYNTGKPALSIPCYGQRRYGHVLDEELEMAIPADLMEKSLDGLRWLSSRGFRYPIPHWGTETDPRPGLAASYGQR